MIFLLQSSGSYSSHTSKKGPRKKQSVQNRKSTRSEHFTSISGRDVNYKWSVMGVPFIKERAPKGEDKSQGLHFIEMNCHV